MIKTIQWIVLSAALASATPAYASPRDAAFMTSGDWATTQSVFFSGATLNLGLDRRGKLRPQGALRLTGAVQHHDSGSLKMGTGWALSFGQSRKPRLTVGGLDASELGKRLNMSDGAKTAVIAGGVVILLAGALLLSADGVVDEINEDGGCC